MNPTNVVFVLAGLARREKVRVHQWSRGNAKGLMSVRMVHGRNGSLPRKRLSPLKPGNLEDYGTSDSKSSAL